MEVIKIFPLNTIISTNFFNPDVAALHHLISIGAKVDDRDNYGGNALVAASG